MKIDFNPRISKKFVSFVLRDRNVIDKLKEADLKEEQIAGVVHSILIIAFQKFDVNINEIINYTKKHSTESRE